MSALQVLAALVSLALIGFALVVIERARHIAHTERALRAARAAPRHVSDDGDTGVRLRLRR